MKFRELTKSSNWKVEELLHKCLTAHAMLCNCFFVCCPPPPSEGEPREGEPMATFYYCIPSAWLRAWYLRISSIGL